MRILYTRYTTFTYLIIMNNAVNIIVETVGNHIERDIILPFLQNDDMSIDVCK